MQWPANSHSCMAKPLKLNSNSPIRWNIVIPHRYNNVVIQNVTIVSNWLQLKFAVPCTQGVTNIWKQMLSLEPNCNSEALPQADLTTTQEHWKSQQGAKTMFTWVIKSTDGHSTWAWRTERVCVCVFLCEGCNSQHCQLELSAAGLQSSWGGDMVYLPYIWWQG